MVFLVRAMIIEKVAARDNTPLLHLFFSLPDMLKSGNPLFKESLLNAKKSLWEMQQLQSESAAQF
jgi:hypothetical protein